MLPARAAAPARIRERRLMKILITGGAGHVGRKLRGELAGRYQFRVMDAQPVTDLRPGEEAVQADITDLAAVEKAMEGMDGCIHLAAIPIEAPWEEMLPVNIAGTANIYEAARRKGVRRI